MLNHAITFSERLNSVVMIYISVVEQLDGGPRECQNQMNQPVNGSNRKNTTPYPIPEQIHDGLK